MRSGPDFEAELAALEASSLRRRLPELGEADGCSVEWEGRRLTNFASNDYLGLAACAEVREAAAEAARRWGVGSGSARLMSGNHPEHRRLEEELAALKGTARALVFSSGFAAAVGTLPALAGREDVLILDKLCHACLVDGARLSGATMRVFRHNDVDQMAGHLRWADGRARRVWVVTESVFSMDGDRAPLEAMVPIAERHGAALIVDEAHATGVLGAGGGGLSEVLGLSGRIAVQMGTLSKALGSSGGFIAASGSVIDWLLNRARSFVFSTGPGLPMSAAARAALAIVRSERGAHLRGQVMEHARRLDANAASAIVPVAVGDEAEALRRTARLREEGLWVPAVRYPTVRRGAARLRVTVTAGHGAEEVARLKAALDRFSRVQTDRASV